MQKNFRFSCMHEHSHVIFADTTAVFMVCGLIRHCTALRTKLQKLYEPGANNQTIFKKQIYNQKQHLLYCSVFPGLVKSI